MSEVKRYYVQTYKLDGDQQKYAHGALGAVAMVRAEDYEKLERQLQPVNVRDVVSFAYIETLSSRQIHQLLTKIHERNQELQAVVNMTAEAFDGGPDHPWIPGFDAQKIYKAVMKNYAPPLPSGQSGDPSL